MAIVVRLCHADRVMVRLRCDLNTLCALRSANRALVCVSAIVAMLLVCLSPGARAADASPLRVPDTSSPRATLQGFIQTTDDIYLRWADLLTKYAESGELFPTAAQRRVQSETLGRVPNAVHALDLSEVALVELGIVGAERAIQLREILDRIDLPSMQDVPDAAAMANLPAKRWRLPDTEIDFTLVQQGPRAGEYLVSPETVARLPDFYPACEGPALQGRSGAPRGGGIPPLQSQLGPHALRHPDRLPARPELLYPATLGVELAGLEHGQDRRRNDLAMDRRWHRGPRCRTADLFQPTAGNVAVAGQRGRSEPPLAHATDADRHPDRRNGADASAVRNHPHRRHAAHCHRGAGNRCAFLTCAWLALVGSAIVGEMIVGAEHLGIRSLDGQLIRLGSRLVGAVIAVGCLIKGADELGFPAYSMLAGLGVGGLAVALAAKDSLANLLGSMLIMFEKPFRVGHYIRLSGTEGTVEDVGFRSTRIRTLDNSLISIPNDSVVNTKVDNLSLRPKRRQRFTLGVTYDTPAGDVGSVRGRDSQGDPGSLSHGQGQHPGRVQQPGRQQPGYTGDFPPHGHRLPFRTEGRHEVLVRIMDLAERMHVSFAFPTRTLLIEAAPGGEATDRSGIVIPFGR